MNFKFTTDVFENHAFAAGVGRDVMGRRHEPHVFLDNRAHAHALGGRDGFLHVRARAEQKEAKFPRRESFAEFFRLDFLVFGKAGEVKQTDVQPFSLMPSTVTGKSKALVPTIPYLVSQRSPALSPGAVPTNSFPLGTTMMFDLRSMPNSSVRAKMIEPSLGLIVMPVQAVAS